MDITVEMLELTVTAPDVISIDEVTGESYYIRAFPEGYIYALAEPTGVNELTIKEFDWIDVEYYMS